MTELMEEAMDEPEAERLRGIAQFAANGEAVLAAIPARRTLPMAYYQRVGFLVTEVEEHLRGGITMGPRDIPADVALGLRAIEAGRREFARLHPGCGRCGTPVPNAGLRFCQNCEIEAMKEKRR